MLQTIDSCVRYTEYCFCIYENVYEFVQFVRVLILVFENHFIGL